METPIDQLQQKGRICFNIFKSLLDTVCFSLRNADSTKKLFEILQSPQRQFTLENEQNNHTINAVENERSSVIKLLYNAKKKDIENNGISLRSSLTLFLSILWDPKVDSSTSSLDERDQLLLLIITKSIIDQMVEMFYNVHLTMALFDIQLKNVDIVCC